MREGETARWIAEMGGADDAALIIVGADGMQWAVSLSGAFCSETFEGASIGDAPVYTHAISRLMKRNVRGRGIFVKHSRKNGVGA
jgi:hypothetical protein